MPVRVEQVVLRLLEGGALAAGAALLSFRTGQLLLGTALLYGLLRWLRGRGAPGTPGKLEAGAGRVLEVVLVAGGLSVAALPAGKLFLGCVLAHVALTWCLERPGPLVADKAGAAKTALAAALLVGLVLLFVEPGLEAVRAKGLVGAGRLRSVHVTLVLFGAALLAAWPWRSTLRALDAARLALAALCAQGLGLALLGADGTYLGLSAARFANGLWAAAVLATSLHVAARWPGRAGGALEALAVVGAAPALLALWEGRSFASGPLLGAGPRVWLEPFWVWTCVLLPLAAALAAARLLAQLARREPPEARSGEALALLLALVATAAGLVVLERRGLPSLVDLLR